MLTIQTDNHGKMKLLASFLKFCTDIPYYNSMYFGAYIMYNIILATLHLQTRIYNTADYNNYSNEITAVYIHKIINLQ